MKNYAMILTLLVANLTTMSVQSHTQQKTCIINDSGKKVCGTPFKSGGIAAATKSSVPSVNLHFPSFNQNTPDDVINLKVQLQKCARKKSIVSCRFSILKTEGDKEDYMLLFAANNSIVAQATDTENNEYNAANITVGAETSVVHVTKFVGKSQAFSATIAFPIPSKASTIKTVRFPISRGMGLTVRIAEFSNISISR